MPAQTEVQRVLEEFAYGTSMHGVPRIIKAKSMHARIFWSIICLGAFLMFLWQSAILLERFYSYPKKVNVEIVQKPIPFPSVSVCNTDHMDLEYVDQLEHFLFGTKFTANNSNASSPVHQTDLSDFLGEYSKFQYDASNFLNMFFMSTGVDGNKEEAYDSMIELFSRHGLTANLGRELASQAGVKLPDFIVGCRFLGKPCNISTSFTTYFDPYYFNCFTFQPHTTIPKRAMRLQGLEYGLSLLLFAGSAGQLSGEGDPVNYNLIPGMQESDSALASGKGARVVVHSVDTLPHPTAEGYDIPPGYSINVGFKARENMRIRPPHGNCTEGEDILGSTAQSTCWSSGGNHSDSTGRLKPACGTSSYKYTLITCQNTCIQKAIMNTCSCIDNRLTPPDDMQDLPYCLTLPQIPEYCIIDMPSSPMGGAGGHMDMQIDYTYDENGEGPLPLPGSSSEDYSPPIVDMPEECKLKLSSFARRMQCKKEVYENMTIVDPRAMEKCSCYPPCNDIVYDASYSLSNLPEWTDEHSAFYAGVESYMEKHLPLRKKAILREKGKDKDYKKHVFKLLSRLNVHIADSNIMKTIESPDYEAIRLVSDIGGQLGLWIGISVITLFEVVQLVADLFKYLTYTGRNIEERNVNGNVVTYQEKPHLASPEKTSIAERRRQRDEDITSEYEVDKLTSV